MRPAGTSIAMFSIVKFKMISNQKRSFGKFIALGEGISTDKINADKSEIVLKNGRTIKYENLVVAVGQKNNFEHIAGFEDAWADRFHPFYTNLDHSSWKTDVNKAARTHKNFNGGEAIFYIPPGNFHG